MTTNFTYFACFLFLFLSFHNSHASDNNASSTELEVQRVRINFVSPSGDIRPLLLGFTSNDEATDGIDYGYDARNYDNFPNDMSWMINEEKFVIQGVGRYQESKKYELGMLLDETGEVKIELTGLENFENDIPVFIYDAVEDTYTQINNKKFLVNLEPGSYMERFYIAFSNENSTLSVPDIADKDNFNVYKNTYGDNLTVSSSKNFTINSISIISIDGKRLFNLTNVDSNTIEIPTHNLKHIPFVMTMTTNDNSMYIKKMVVN